MKVVIWLVMLGFFFYTIGFGLSLWKEKNKTGALAVFALAAATVASSYYGLFK